MTPPTDRTIRGPGELDSLRFDDRGLIPVVAQEADAGAVLMVAWATRDALEHTLETGFMHYWSRSREELWKKGATSGNLQRVVSLHADCDGDTVLARVHSAGPACHTGEPTCFGRSASPRTAAGDAADAADSRILDELWRVLESRDRERPEGSYTTRLLTDENLRLKKLGEEVTELVTALVRGDGRAPEEGADLVYHLLVALKAAGHDWSEVLAELERRKR